MLPTECKYPVEKTDLRFEIRILTYRSVFCICLDTNLDETFLSLKIIMIPYSLYSEFSFD